jgi:hypothetical protein
VRGKGKEWVSGREDDGGGGTSEWFESSGSGGEGRHVKFWLGEVLERMARNVSGPKRRNKSEAS